MFHQTNPNNELKSADRSRNSQNRPRFAIILAIIWSEFTILWAVSIPGTLQFDGFAFGDDGSNLTIQYLMGHGLMPLKDLGYHYGLLPLVVGRIWFGLFGANAQAYVWSG
jgi:hypothetical protein